MTVVNEITDQERSQKIQFVELLEMIGRIADVKYRDKDEEALPLSERCMMVLEMILPLVGRQVNPVVINEESDSESDDEY